MATKTLDIELSEGIAPIWVNPKYDSLYILVRYCKQPIGWVWYSIPHPNISMITVDQLQQAIFSQLGEKWVSALVNRQLNPCESKYHPTEPISIVVCTRNRTQQLALCLKSLLSLDYPTYEIIVVDNAPSNDDTAKLVSNLPVRYVREEHPGLDWARNRGIAEAQYGIVAFTDDDAQVDRFWLHTVNRALAQPEVMSVTGFVAPSELETIPQIAFEFDYGGMGHGLCRREIRRDRLSEQELLWASSFGVGVNMVFRRSIFEKIGLFDVALDVGTPSRGAGDVEMFHRLVAAGHTLIYEPGMIVWHTHRRYLPALHQQIYDNGRSFGCYLLTCLSKRSVSGISILKFFLYNWLFKWIFCNLVFPPRKLPRYIALIELAGMLSSPLAYRATQANAKRISAMHLQLKIEQRQPEEALV